MRSCASAWIWLKVTLGMGLGLVRLPRVRMSKGSAPSGLGPSSDLSGDSPTGAPWRPTRWQHGKLPGFTLCRRNMLGNRAPGESCVAREEPGHDPIAPPFFARGGDRRANGRANVGAPGTQGLAIGWVGARASKTPVTRPPLTGQPTRRAGRFVALTQHRPFPFCPAPCCSTSDGTANRTSPLRITPTETVAAGHYHALSACSIRDVVFKIFKKAADPSFSCRQYFGRLSWQIFLSSRSRTSSPANNNFICII
ncbi:hypothetical protein B0T16DRAFT_195035 [Cercophora newfieldiana]|uniref:Secreted protein n=1 Tax=Cercophora newfieldiana TaxID=92897 RepID=A0AA39Y1H7_9PEZI|nr:hypothetical protein B0T16DRAFT_195035 [Cercophora newfieldiana]